MSARAEGPLPGADLKRVFIVGCPRSGTTWLQLLMAQHAAVATSQETHLFSRYLRQLERMWKREVDAPASARKVGLQNVLSEDEFIALCREFARGVLDKVAGSRPGAAVVVEKTPNHLRRWELILKIFPDAYFIHLIRDPRSVVSSLTSSAKGWGRRWAPTNPVEAAKRWRADVRKGRKIAGATTRYHEVFYEKLLEDGAAQLEAILNWLELPADRAFCEEAVEACSIEKLRKASSAVKSPWSLGNEPQGFFRKGTANAWREDLSAGELRLVEHITGDLMAELGYTPVFRLKRRRPVSLVVRETYGWVRERLRWRLGTAIRKL